MKTKTALLIVFLILIIAISIIAIDYITYTPPPIEPAWAYPVDS